MQRDGALKSLWQQVPEYTPQNTVTGNEIVDVIVVGGGITGLSTALALQKAGKQCLLLEAHTIGFGTTGGTTAHLNTMLDTDYHTIEQKFGEESAQLVATIARQSIDLIMRNVQEYHIDCDFTQRQGVLYAQDEDQEKQLEKIFQATQKAGVPVQWSTGIPVPIPFTKAMLFDGQASFHPTKYILGLAKAYEQAGGLLLQQCRVTKLDEDDLLTVTTSRDTFRAHNLVYATHVPPGVNLLHFRCAPYRSYALALKLNGDQYPDSLAYDMYDPYHYFRTHQHNGEKYLVAGGEDHKTGHETDTEACFDKLEKYCRQYFDISEVAYRWSSQYFEPTDGLPYIGHLPGHGENMFVATGFSGNGMIYGTAASMILTEMIMGQQESPYQELFDPSRIKMVAGFSNFVKESADVVGLLAGKLFGGEKLKEWSELQNGEAKVVTHDGKKLAIYKDDNGEVHALNAACTHIKCDVAWNNAEKSWDCPCHGSRFSIHGEMLTGPARKDLQAYDKGEE